jgi:hypothetical protein
MIRKLTNRKGNQSDRIHGDNPTLKTLVFAMVTTIVIANSIIVFSEADKRHSIALWVLNITAFTASALGVVTICRYGIHGIHGRSYLYLTIGIILWCSADFVVLYSYYALPAEEREKASIADALWFIGYGFLSLHLFTVLCSVYKTINLKLAVMVALLCLLFIFYNLFALFSSENILKDIDLTAIIVTIAYPVLDLTLIIPSILVLLSLRRDYQQSIPWFLSSLSLLINALADDGYVYDFANGNMGNLWFWELFYVADFIIIAGALIWYNKFHISYELSTRRLNVK